VRAGDAGGDAALVVGHTGKADAAQRHQVTLLCSRHQLAGPCFLNV